MTAEACHSRCRVHCPPSCPFSPSIWHGPGSCGSVPCHTFLCPEGGAGYLGGWAAPRGRICLFGPSQVPTEGGFTAWLPDPNLPTGRGQSHLHVWGRWDWVFPLCLQPTGRAGGRAEVRRPHFPPCAVAGAGPVTTTWSRTTPRAAPRASAMGTRTAATAPPSTACTASPPPSPEVRETAPSRAPQGRPWADTLGPEQAPHFPMSQMWMAGGPCSGTGPQRGSSGRRTTTTCSVPPGGPSLCTSWPLVCVGHAGSEGWDVG